jgi:hypothetical protein
MVTVAMEESTAALVLLAVLLTVVLMVVLSSALMDALTRPSLEMIESLVCNE